MTAPAPPDQTRPTRHRAEPSTPDVLRRFAPPLVAVAAVAVVILLLVVLNSRPSAPGPAPGAVAQPPTSATQPPLSSPPVLTSPSAAGPPPTSTVAPPPVSQPPATQAPAAAKAAVTVLNNSRRTGLAKHVAAEVRAKGWPVRQTGNFRGRIAQTTLYYATGQQAQAEALAHAMPQIKRVEPRFPGLPGSGLTLVVTRDWSS